MAPQQQLSPPQGPGPPQPGRTLPGLLTISLDYKRTFLEIKFLRLIHPEVILKEFHSCATQRERRSVPQATRIDDTFFTRNDKQNTGTIPMPTFAGRPSTMSSSILVEFPQNSFVGQQRPQTSELQFDKFSCPQSFLFWKIRFKNQVTTSSDFPSEAMLWIKKWRWLIH